MNTLPHCSLIVFDIFITSNVKVSFQVGQSLLKRVVTKLEVFESFKSFLMQATKFHWNSPFWDLPASAQPLQRAPVLSRTRSGFKKKLTRYENKSWQYFSKKLTRFQNQRVASRPHGIPQWIGGAHHQVGGGAKISQLLSKTEKDLLQMKFRRRRRRQNSTLPNLLAANRDSRNRRISSYWKQSRGSITFWYIGCIF